MNRLLIIIGIIMTMAILAAFIPGSYGGRALDKAKSLGYIEYPRRRQSSLQWCAAHSATALTRLQNTALDAGRH